MFSYCTSLISFPDISKWDIEIYLILAICSLIVNR